MIPAYIRKAARIIDRYWFAPRRRKQWMERAGVEDLITRIDVAKRQHKPCATAQAELNQRVTAMLRSEVNG